MDAMIEKVNLAQWILGLSDEFMIRKVSKSIAKIKEEVESQDDDLAFSTYKSLQSREFNFEDLKKEQDIVPFKEGELDALIVEADIQESIEELLESID